MSVTMLKLLQKDGFKSGDSSTPSNAAATRESSAGIQVKPDSTLLIEETAVDRTSIM